MQVFEVQFCKVFGRFSDLLLCSQAEIRPFRVVSFVGFNFAGGPRSMLCSVMNDL